MLTRSSCVQVAALRSHASECAAEAERAQRSALQFDAVHAASSAEEVAQLREQVCLWSHRLFHAIVGRAACLHLALLKQRAGHSL